MKLYKITIVGRRYCYEVPNELFYRAPHIAPGLGTGGQQNHPAAAGATTTGLRYNPKDFVNFDSATMYAENDYWGGSCPPHPSQLDGDISTDNCLTTSPTGFIAQRLDSGGPGLQAGTNGNKPSMSVARTPNDPDTQLKKTLIAQYNQLIAAQPGTPAAEEALKQLYSFVRTDSQNKLGQKGTILSYLTNLYTTHNAFPLGNTALHLMIIEHRENHNLSKAISLSETARGHLSGSGVMFNLVFMYLQDGNLKRASSVADAYASEFPKNQTEIEMLEGTLAKAPQELGYSASSQILLPATASENPDRLHDQAPALFSHNYPNPFNPETTIRYEIQERGRVTLKIYNLLGEAIRTLVDEVQAPGVHSVRWDGKDRNGVEVASGVYLSRLRVGERVETRKMLLVR